MGTMAEQYKTWYRVEKARENITPGLQMDTRYENWNGKHPNGFPQDPKLDETWHPKPCDLKLQYSCQGEWVRVPKSRDDQSGPDYKEFNITRLEKYVDKDGKLQKAICYKRDDRDLNIWFRYEDMVDSFDNWTIPDPPYYYNTNRWMSKMRTEYEKKEKKKKKSTRVDTTA